MRRGNMAPRDELLAAVAKRYRSSPRADRARNLDAFAAVTGSHPTRAMRLLRSPRAGRRRCPTNVAVIWKRVAGDR